MSSVQIAEKIAPPPQSIQPSSDLSPARNYDSWQEAAVNLFTAMIVADSRILPVEIDEMEAALKDCFSKHGSRSVVEVSLRDNAQRIHRILRGPGKRYWLGIQYMKLRDYPDHMELLDRLWKISVCDGSLDEREGELIDFFAHMWRRI